jgi:hypothetical protein
MASIDLPRALRAYFAFAETAPARNGRRFSITMPYVRPDGGVDRLQWWYHLSPAQEKALGESAADCLRTQATARFELHIERWLQNTAHVLYGDGAIPQLGTVAGERAVQPLAAAPSDSNTPSDVLTPELAPGTRQPAEKSAFG